MASPARRRARASIRGASFDDLVGAGEDRWRYGQPERLRGIEVDDQLEPGRLLNGQVGRLGALEDPSGVSTDQAKGGRKARFIADQTAGRDKLAPLVERRDSMA